MGIVLKQSATNTIITFIGFAIGAVNALFMYTHFLGEDYYGLTAFLLSSANIVMPLMAFGIQNTLVKFYSTHESEEDKSRFLNFVLVLPLIVIVPLFIVLFGFYKPLASILSQQNPIIYDYVWIIPMIGLFMGYFEIFYAWVKVHLQSVYGSFVKEVLLRILISIFLFAVYFDVISPQQFVFALMGIYFLSLFAMFLYAMKVKTPRFNLVFPDNAKAVLTYCFFIILSGSVANLLLDVDKFMLNFYINIDNIAFYSVAIFIATVIAVPSRAMHQITYPITAKLMSENKHDELNNLYKKSSITLQVIGGLILVGILVNINELYSVLPEGYSEGIAVVFLIGISKYFDLVLGNNNAIIFNSKYYQAVLFLGLFLVFLTVSLNMIFIPLYGLNGAAIATLISITLYSLAKLLFVVLRMKLFPFTKNTIVALVLTIVSFGVFYYWDFSFHPFVNIILKSILVTIFYLGLSYYLKISSDINFVMNSVFKKFLK